MTWRLQVFKTLLNLFCIMYFRDFPTVVMTKLLRKIECLDHEAIPYDVFKSGVFTCCVLEGMYVCSPLKY